MRKHLLETGETRRGWKCPETMACRRHDEKNRRRAKGGLRNLGCQGMNNAMVNVMNLKHTAGRKGVRLEAVLNVVLS